MAETVIMIVESFEVEGKPVEAHGRLFSFFGTAVCLETRGFGFLKPKTIWTKKFYATSEGVCYDFVEGDYMVRTTTAFQSTLQTKVDSSNDEAYIKLLERAKKIS